MFKKIFIENDIKNHFQVQKILENLKSYSLPITYIHKVEDVFNQVKRPYLQKREGLHLFLGQKKGQLIKEAPDAYGTIGDPHYYFIHAYNCIYECEYCYLQGYFSSPDIVLFINHDDIAQEMLKLYQSNSLLNDANKKTIWFHAGEFSDSLALSHISQELPFYFNLFKDLPQAKLELRTKSANIKSLLQLSPLPNIITSYSLAPHQKCLQFDHKASPLSARLKAIKLLSEKGHPLAFHFDPIIYGENLKEEYEELIDNISQHFDWKKLQYISLGVVRFTQDVFHQLKKNYPQSQLLSAEFSKSFDNKVRYIRPLRLNILMTIKKLLRQAGVEEQKIYLCMEKEQRIGFNAENP